MTVPNVRVVGIDQVTIRIASIPPKLRQNLRVAVEKGNVLLVASTKEKLSGPVLRNKTGRLRRSINSRITETPNSIVGTVGTNVVYAAVHEYGFDGIVTVREHLRMIKQAFGRSIVPKEATVREHPMHMHLPERSFLRSSLRENAGALRALLQQAVAQSIA